MKVSKGMISEFCCCSCCFLGPPSQHMVVPRLGVQSELQLPAYTTATATRDLSQVCNLPHISRQHWILNPLSEARDRTRNLVVPRQICFHCAMMGTPLNEILNFVFCSPFCSIMLNRYLPENVRPIQITLTE